MRLTRAARRAEVAHDISPPNHASDAHTSGPNIRIPLGNVSINPIREPIEPELLDFKAMTPKKPKAKSTAKKSAKTKNPKAQEEGDVEVAPVVLEDERQAAGSPASDAAADDLAASPTSESMRIALDDQIPASPPSRAVRMTRRKLAKQDEAITQSRSEPTPAEVVFSENAEASRPTDLGVEAHSEDTTAGHQDVVSELPEEEAKKEPPAPVTACAAEDSQPIQSQSAGASEGISPGSHTPRTSPSKSPAKAPLPLEESIEAIDALEEALENVIPEFNPIADEQSPRKQRPNTTQKPQRGLTTKNVPPRASMVTRSARPSVARSSSVRAASTKERKGSGEVVDYLASRRRPISIHFPPPPPPPKAAKPPTVSNFQLPGEAVAAKLKAQKEERLKREQESGHRRQSSATLMRPPVKSSKPPTKPNFQLPGEAVAAKLKAQKEERLKRESQGLAVRPSSTTFQPPVVAKSSKPPTVPNFQLPGEAIAAKLKAQREERLKREEEEGSKKPAFKARPAPAQKSGTVVVRQTAASKARESMLNGEKKENAPSTATVARRASSVQAMNRSSIVVAPKAPMAPVDAAALKQKGREIFNRDKMEKEQRERERREKEEAAKKARAEAAERGRIASREWAQKQRKKMMAAASTATVNGNGK